MPGPGGDFASLADHLRPFVAYFAGCRHVIDLGSGEGTFLQLLREQGIATTGVDNDPDLADQRTRSRIEAAVLDLICEESAPALRRAA